MNTVQDLDKKLCSVIEAMKALLNGIRVSGCEVILNKGTKTKQVSIANKTYLVSERNQIISMSCGAILIKVTTAGYILIKPHSSVIIELYDALYNSKGV